jgi:hypothetical protein
MPGGRWVTYESHCRNSKLKWRAIRAADIRLVSYRSDHHFDRRLGLSTDTPMCKTPYFKESWTSGDVIGPCCRCLGPKSHEF